MILLLILACSPSDTPEAFGQAYQDAACAAAEECGQSEEAAAACESRAAAELFTAESCPDWSPERAAACVELFEDLCTEAGVVVPTECRASTLGCDG